MCKNSPGQSSTTNSSNFYSKNMSGSNSGVTSQTPDPLASLAYQQVLSNASQIANTPYQPYQGQLVAGFTPDQLAAQQGYRDLQGYMQPYVNQSMDWTKQATAYADPNRYFTEQPKYYQSYNQITSPYTTQAGQMSGQMYGLSSMENFNQQALNRYMNPFQSNVIDATLAQMKQNQSELVGKNTADAIRQGSYGGSGQFLGLAELGRQQALSNAQTLAQLNAQNYNQAMQQYNQQQGVAMQGAQQAYGNQMGLGAFQKGLIDAANQQYNAQQRQAIDALFGGADRSLQAGQTGLAGKTTELGALDKSGATQQALAQNQLDKAYQQWQQARAYPYQQTSYFANLAQGLGPLMGTYGTSASNYQGTESGFDQGQKQTKTSGGGGGLLGMGMSAIGGLLSLNTGGSVTPRAKRATGGYMEQVGASPYGKGPIDMKAGLGALMGATPYSGGEDYIGEAQKTSQVMKPAKQLAEEKIQSELKKAMGEKPKFSGSSHGSSDDEDSSGGSEQKSDIGSLAKKAGKFAKDAGWFDTSSLGTGLDQSSSYDIGSSSPSGSADSFGLGDFGSMFNGLFNQGGRVHKEDGGSTETSDKDYLTALYQKDFGRAPDQAGIDYWIDQLGKGKTRADVASAFEASPEMEGITNANKDWLSDLYQLDFKRGPDPEGFAYWQQQLKEGMPREEVIKKFGQTPESTSAIEDLYQSKLGRASDFSGLDYWKRQMQSGLGLTNMGRYFGQSPEAGKALEKAYTKAFGRGPEQSAVKYAQGQLAGPLSLAEAEASFYNTPEYKASHPATPPKEGSYADLLYKAYKNDPGPQLSPENQGIADMPTSYYYNKYSGLTGATPQIQGYYSNIANTTVNPYTGLFNLGYSAPYFGSSPSYDLAPGVAASEKLRGVVSDKLASQLPKTSADGGRINRARGGSAMSKEDIARAALQAGATPQEAAMLTAIAMPESGRNPYAHNPNWRTGDNSYGLWQINMLGRMGPERMRQFGLKSYNDLFDPVTNAKAALQLLRGKGGLKNWTTYTSGKCKPYYADAANVVNALVKDPNAVKAPINMPEHPTMMASYEPGSDASAFLRSQGIGVAQPGQPRGLGLLARLIREFSPISTAQAGESALTRINPADPSGPLLPENKVVATDSNLPPLPEWKKEIRTGFGPLQGDRPADPAQIVAKPEVPLPPKRSDAFPVVASDEKGAETKPGQKYWGDYRDVESSGLGDFIDTLAGDVRTSDRPGTRETPMGKYQGQGLGALFDFEGSNPYAAQKPSKKDEETSDFGGLFDIFG